MHRMVKAALLMTVVLLATACGGKDDDGGAAASTSTTSTTVKTVVAKIPPELLGRWKVDFDNGFTAAVTLYEYGIYQTSANGEASGGDVAVDGDTLVFSGGGTCEGDGTYRWAVAGDVLTLASLGDDPCPRAGLLKVGHFVRDK